MSLIGRYWGFCELIAQQGNQVWRPYGKESQIERFHCTSTQWCIVA